MRPWLKETLICTAFGAATVGVIFGLGAVFGARFGPCGPVNGASVFLVIALLPALFAGGFAHDCIGNESLSTVVMAVTPIGSYSLAVYIVRRIVRRKDAEKRSYR